MSGDVPKGTGSDRDQSYIEDILDSARRIEQYVGSASFQRFQAEPMLQDAVLRRLSVIGEAAACLSVHFKDTRADVPWRSVVGFRNLVVHRYWAVDIQIVWKIVSEDVPALLECLADTTAPT